MARRADQSIISWLRALAHEEHARCGGPGVGAVGMCFTGGFALGMMVDDVVVAPVLSQPSLPFPVTKAPTVVMWGWGRRTWPGGESGPKREPACSALRFTGDKLVPAGPVRPPPRGAG